MTLSPVVLLPCNLLLVIWLSFGINNGYILRPLYNLWYLQLCNKMSQIFLLFWYGFKVPQHCFSVKAKEVARETFQSPTFANLLNIVGGTKSKPEVICSVR